MHFIVTCSVGARLLLRGMTHPSGAADRQCLARLGLDKPTTFAERIYRALVSASLEESGG